MPVSRNGRNFSKKWEFVDVVSNYYYVDKSLLIKEVIDNEAGDDAILITRPRRFGKSLNITMLQTFFEKTDEDNSVYFKDLEIWKCGEKYTSEQGKYPVIYLDFKECESDTFEGAMELIKDTVASEFTRHKELEASEKVDRLHDLKMYEMIGGMNVNTDELKKSLSILCRMLHDHHGVKPIILIDEYDVPIQNAYEHGYYSEMTEFFRNFLSAGLKGNRNLHIAFITGTMRIAKASIFTGLNNLGVYSVMSGRYSQYFGFTKKEVKKILSDFRNSKKIKEACDWYDGYHFAGTDIFNPWSVSQYVSSGFVPFEYWLDSSGNSIIKDLLKKPTDKDVATLRGLLNGVPVTDDIKENISYGDLNMTENDKHGAIYSVMLATGYLTPEYDELGLRHFVIPNEEVRRIYSKEILIHLWGSGGPGFGERIKTAFAHGSAEMLETVMQEALCESTSYLDFPKETSEDGDKERTGERPYHNFVGGLSLAVDDEYMVRSNEESGLGRFDMTYIPRNVSSVYPGVIIEFEVAKSGKDIDAEVEEALRQIDDKMYDAKLKDAGVTRIDKYAMVFFGKKVKVVKKEN